MDPTEDSEHPMPAKTLRQVTLLLNRNVESLGIVGDVVKVRPGYARNYLLPLGIAEVPTEERIEALKAAREEAMAQLEVLRTERRGIITALEDLAITLVRSCNDRGILYGSVTQRDIADALNELGHRVDERAVRLANPIRRVGEYPVVIQFEKEMRVEILIKVDADRSIADESEEMEFDNEGELIEKPRPTAEESGSEDSETSEDASESPEGGSETADSTED
ncbi:MAG: 50S ribosomal protein L9 [Phycisphaerae bacterium]|nr:50S ribosomal protein L9 [Phycisphaerae bacterium]